MVDTAYQILFTAALCVLGVLALLGLIRAILGPLTTDRIVAVNMMSTIVIVMIGILALMLHEGYLADVGLIYAMISFLSVVVLCKVFMGVHNENKEKQAQEEGEKHA
ncbi:MAG: sodium:proton antiporter [Clostridiales bacterium]|nr:sodium:proton antiporter [Clostridiales bacterium]